MNCLIRIAVVFAGISGITATAAPVYKCVDANGAIGFQATPCPANATQTDAVIRNDRATPVAAPATKGASARRIPISGGRMPEPSIPRAPYVPPAPMTPPPSSVSYECRLPNGEVFYRHDGCPNTASTGTSYTTDSFGRSFPSSNEVAVSGRQVSREEACKKMNSAGAIGREGRGRDQSISTYDKNRGIDPCK